ncbi:MAG TPA: hypothetical protein VGO26_01590 [Amnibacterium sp.]|nr:hypothetical protein [Amnibacterium sp.]
MPIPFFGPAQTDAFIPALAWFFVATVLAVTPVVLAPVLARMRRGRVVTIVAVALAAVAVIPGVVQVGRAFTVLGDQHALVQRTMSEVYGVPVSSADAASLLEGARITAPGYEHPIQLEAVAPGRYAPVQADVGPLPLK